MYAINGKDYLFVIGSLNEPASVDDKTGVDFRGIWPNATDPTNSQANGTQPITGLENSLKVEISAGDKNMTSDLEPAFGELGVYESKTFYPTIATTYSFRIFGDINRTLIKHLLAIHLVERQQNLTIPIPNFPGCGKKDFDGRIWLP